MLYEIYEESWIRLDRILQATIEEIDDEDKLDVPDDCEYVVEIQFMNDKSSKYYLNEVERLNFVRAMRGYSHEIL
jgi:hypothetical protein